MDISTKVKIHKHKYTVSKSCPEKTNNQTKKAAVLKTDQNS